MKSSVINRAVEISKKFKSISSNKENTSVKLDKLIEMTAKSFECDAAACFLVIDDNYLELFASYNFNKNLNNKIFQRVGEGIVGKVAQNKRTAIIENFQEHPDFLRNEKFSEKKFKSILSTPIIRWGRAIGVICLYKKDLYEFKNEVIDFETLAMACSDWIASDEVREYKNSLMSQRGQNNKDYYKGLSLSKGYGYGAAVIHRRRQIVKKIFAEDKNLEEEKLNKSYNQMNNDLDKKFNSSKLGFGEHADILDAYRMFAKDKGWYKRIIGHIEGGLTAEAAVERAFEDMWNRLSATKDSYLRERLHDLRDVADRLLSYLCGDNTDVKYSELKEIVLVAQTMGPADLMDYDYKKIKALILEDGTATMHVAIVAKALGIPVVSKIKNIFKEIKTGEILAVNGDEGLVYVRPSQKILDLFQKKIEDKKLQIAQMAKLKKLQAKTLNKKRINMYINVGLDFDLDYIESTNCDGVGLYRTEIPFMTAEKMPDVAQQYDYYKKLMDKAGDKKVVFRSLDVGSDKLLPYWSYSGEENPAIGWRSIRITLDRRAILRQQMQAFIKAAAGKELNVMFPMIANLSEFRDAKETLMIELEKERKSDNPLPTKVNIGLMIEVPSVVFQLDAILPEADFISVGTNDLAQFVFACDRTNNRLAQRYDVLSVPFLRIMQQIIEKANQHKVVCSVCGEMASDPLEALVLIGLGYRNLSVSGAAFGKIKKMIRSADTDKIADYVKTLLDYNQRTLRPQLTAYAFDHAIEFF